MRDKTSSWPSSTPLDAAFTKPVASQHLAGLLAEKGIALETEFAAGEVDGEGGSLSWRRARELAFDLLVTVPLHGGAAYVGRSPGLGDELGFVPTDPTRCSRRRSPTSSRSATPPTLPTSKAGSVTHFEGETLVENIGRFFAGEDARRAPSTATPTASSRRASTRPC